MFFMKTLLEMFNIQGDRNNSQYVKYLDCNVFGEVRDISDNEKDSHSVHGSSFT